jgi:hypothetical protein
MSLSNRARTGWVVAGAAVLAIGTGTAVSATEDAPPPPPEEPGSGEEFLWPPPDSEGQWLPVPDEINQSFPVAACDTTVVVGPGDVFELQYHAMHQPDGTIRVEYRGHTTVDVVRESDGAMLDELDVSGPGYEIISPDGLTVTFSWYGPSLIGAFDEVEAAAFAAQGLPPLFYYESGNTTERVVFPEDPEAETIVSAEFLTDTALGVRDVCDMLDDAGS